MTLPFDLREWQTQALERWRAHDHRGIIEVVTGGGKTLFALAAALACKRDLDVGRVIVIAPTLALVDQWYVSLMDALGATEDDIGVWTGASAATWDRPYHVMTLNTARELLPRSSLDGETLLIVDECHRSGSAVNALAITAGPFRGTLGLSATPDSGDGRLERVLIPALGPVVYRYGLQEGLRDGIIAPFRLANLYVPLMEEEDARYRALTRRIAIAARQAKGDATDARLEVLLRARARIGIMARLRIPVVVRLVQVAKGSRTLVFHESIRVTARIEELLRSSGARVASFHSRIAPSVRRDNLRLFRRGRIDVLLSCRALDEGLNVPEVEYAVVAAATASNRQRIQRLGRVLRKTEGKGTASITTLYSTPAEERRLMREADDLLGHAQVSWQRLGYAGE